MRIVIAAVSLAILVAATATAPAHANIRAPVMQDGAFSEHLRGAHPDATLLRERFAARFPSLVVGMRDYNFSAHIEVEYDVKNAGDVPLALPLRFLAVGAQDARIRINGDEVKHVALDDDNERRAALAHIVAHRCAWMNPLDYGPLPAAAPAPAPAPAPARTAPCDAAQGIERIERSMRRLDDGGAVDTLAFDVVLAPGENVIRVEYQQRLQVREGAYGYFTGFGTRGGRFGFEYLLYPAETWRRADGFTFDVNVEVPDPVDPGWFGDAYLTPAVRTNLPLDVVHQPHRTTTVRGTLRDFPAAVFAVVVEVPGN